jgi:triosephosphate isomerase
MLVDLGCSYVEVGHSERRRDYGETQELVAAKVAQVLRHTMTPILCVGEPTRLSLDATVEFVLDQVAGGLAEVRSHALARIVVAYEPVWAIGQGSVTAPRDHVSAIHREIHRWLDRAGRDAGSNSAPDMDGARTNGAGEAAMPRVIYGGSVDGITAETLLAADAVDGLFVGRAALDPAQFARIVAAGERRATTAQPPAGR